MFRKHITEWLLGFYSHGKKYDSNALKTTFVCPELNLSSFALLANLQSEMDSNILHVLLKHLCGIVPFAYHNQHIKIFSTYVLDCTWIDRALKDIDNACRWYSKVNFNMFKKVCIPCYRAANEQNTSGHFFLVVVCVEIKTFIILDSMSNQEYFLTAYPHIGIVSEEYSQYVQAAFHLMASKYPMA